MDKSKITLNYGFREMTKHGRGGWWRVLENVGVVE
jgi:hypothetical protein